MSDPRPELKQSEIFLMFAAARQQSELDLLRENNHALAELLRRTRSALEVG